MNLLSTPFALIMGIFFGLILGNPWKNETARWSKKLLQISVIGMGFGLSLGQVWSTGRDSVGYTIIGIAFTMFMGKVIGKYLAVNNNVSTLISFGTAICGGSAIAAMAPVLKSDNEETAVSLATVFTLNAIALFIFPSIGHLLDMGQEQFGLWAALAIHDTSSVVGAAAAYGTDALATATTVKLTRAVWIAPIALGVAWITKSEGKTKLPLFIIGFIAAAGIRSLFPQWGMVWDGLALAAKQMLVVTLFLVGTGLTRDVLKKVGLRPLIQGLLLWFVVSFATLFAITMDLVKI